MLVAKLNALLPRAGRDPFPDEITELQLMSFHAHGQHASRPFGNMYFSRRMKPDAETLEKRLWYFWYGFGLHSQ